MKQTHVTVFVLGTVITLAAGCSSATALGARDSDETSTTDNVGSVASPEGDESNLMSQDLDEVFTVTEVRFTADGAETVRTGTITRREQIRQREFEAERKKALARGIVLQDTMAIVGAPCTTPGVLHVYDQTNYGGNEYCFDGAGSTNLSGWPRTPSCGRTLGWYHQSYFSCTGIGDPVHRVRSLKAGIWPGAISNGSFCSSGAGACILWWADAEIPSIAGGDCAILFRGGPNPTC